MINHLANYDKIGSINAKMVALLAQKKAIDEEIHRIKTTNMVCGCGYIISPTDYEKRRQQLIPEGTSEFDKQFEYDYCECPVCGKKIYG